MPLQYEILQIIVNPNVAFILILAGIIGIAIELFSPGLVLPGGTGLLSLITGLYASAQLPLTITGVVLLVLGIALLIAETQLPTGGILGGIGVVSLAVSGLLLYDTNDGFEVSPVLVIAVALILGGALWFVSRKVLEARKGRVLTGYEELHGMEGDVRVALDPAGQVFVQGALWRAEPVEEGERIPAGARVRVEAVDGLTLKVRTVGSQSTS